MSEIGSFMSWAERVLGDAVIEAERDEMGRLDMQGATRATKEQMGLSPRGHQPWGEAEIATLMRERDGGASYVEIGMLLRRSATSCAACFQRNNLKRKAKKREN